MLGQQHQFRNHNPREAFVLRGELIFWFDREEWTGTKTLAHQRIDPAYLVIQPGHIQRADLDAAGGQPRGDGWHAWVGVAKITLKRRIVLSQRLESGGGPLRWIVVRRIWLQEEGWCLAAFRDQSIGVVRTAIHRADGKRAPMSRKLRARPPQHRGSSLAVTRGVMADDADTMALVWRSVGPPERASRQKPLVIHHQPGHIRAGPRKIIKAEWRAAGEGAESSAIAVAGDRRDGRRSFREYR